jgi:hypothetical protein
MKFAKDSFVSCSPANELTENRNIRLTRSDNDLYVHLTTRPATSGVWLKPLAKTPKKVTLLNDDSNIEFRVTHLPNSFKSQDHQLHLYDLPIDKFSDEVMIIKLENIL